MKRFINLCDCWHTLASAACKIMTNVTYYVGRSTWTRR